MSFFTKINFQFNVKIKLNIETGVITSKAVNFSIGLCEMRTN